MLFQGNKIYFIKRLKIVPKGRIISGCILIKCKIKQLVMFAARKLSNIVDKRTFYFAALKSENHEEYFT